MTLKSVSILIFFIESSESFLRSSSIYCWLNTFENYSISRYLVLRYLPESSMYVHTVCKNAIPPCEKSLWIDKVESDAKRGKKREHIYSEPVHFLLLPFLSKEEERIAFYFLASIGVFCHCREAWKFSLLRSKVEFQWKNIEKKYLGLIIRSDG